MEGGGLEGTQNAALERALSSLLDLLGTATSVSEDQLTLVSDLVCTVSSESHCSGCLLVCWQQRCARNTASCTVCDWNLCMQMRQHERKTDNLL